MDNLDLDALLETASRALAVEDRIEICSDALYRFSTYGPKARAVLAAIDLPAIIKAAKAEAKAERADWFEGDVDCDGNPLETIRSDELQKLRDERDKLMWQVRDTCARAEKAEAALKAAKAEAYEDAARWLVEQPPHLALSEYAGAIRQRAWL